MAAGDNRNWHNDAIQFPRLLAEILATQDNLDIDGLATSMDLSPEEVRSLFDRAEAAYETIKAAAATGSPGVGRTVLVYGTPADGFTFVGPVTPNDPDLERMTDQHLRDEYWWYADLQPLAEALEEADQEVT